MIVTQENFDSVIKRLLDATRLSLDTETFGLNPYKGDTFFAVIIGCSETEAYYFNFHYALDSPKGSVLCADHLRTLNNLIFRKPNIDWYIHRATFDLHILWQNNIELEGPVWCTQTMARVEYNEHLKYNLDHCLQRIGLEKDDAVKKWIDDNGAWKWENVPGKQKREKVKFFNKVPFHIIAPYALSDATGCYALGEHQRDSIFKQSVAFSSNVPNMHNAVAIERRLTKTVFRMERVGVKIDRKYTTKAALFETGRMQTAQEIFKRESGRQYIASPKLFAEIFADEKERWQYTEKRNPSFDSDVLKTFKSPLAKTVLEIRDAKSKADFYNGFLWYADREDVIHPNFNQTGCRTFRFSSSEPNLQNLTNEEDEEELKQEFVVRRAFIPRPGYVFIMPDFDQMEYKMMLDYAKRIQIAEFTRKDIPWNEDYFELVSQVANGFDIHQATAQLMGVTRKQAKTLNFMLLYGGGPRKLADALGISFEEAQRLRSLYFRKIPYIRTMIWCIEAAVKQKGWIRNWAGYKYHFPDKSFAYTGPNTIIQGGCAAVMKVAMNTIDHILLPTRSRMVLSIHDEAPCEIHESELQHLPKMVKEAMETACINKYVPLTVGMEWSHKSLADKVKGYPV